MDEPNRIRRLRRREELTLKQLAEKVGVSESMMSRYETSDRPIPDDVKRQLAQIFEVSVAYLMRWDLDNGAADGAREAC